MGRRIGQVLEGCDLIHDDDLLTGLLESRDDRVISSLLGVLGHEHRTLNGPLADQVASLADGPDEAVADSAVNALVAGRDRRSLEDVAAGADRPIRHRIAALGGLAAAGDEAAFEEAVRLTAYVRSAEDMKRLMRLMNGTPHEEAFSRQFREWAVANPAEAERLTQLFEGPPELDLRQLDQ